MLERMTFAGRKEPDALPGNRLKSMHFCCNATGNQAADEQRPSLMQQMEGSCIAIRWWSLQVYALV